MNFSAMMKIYPSLLSKNLTFPIFFFRNYDPLEIRNKIQEQINSHSGFQVICAQISKKIFCDFFVLFTGNRRKKAPNETFENYK